MDANVRDLVDKKLAEGLEIVQKVSPLILGYFQNSPEIEFKADQSPVTEADRKAEQAIRESLAKDFPKDSILGEELGKSEGSSPFLWTIDPIDGTQGFTQGVPFFGTMLGLLYEDQPIMGIVHFPALDETLYAVKGEGSFWKPSGKTSFKECRASQVSKIPNAILTCSSPEAFKNNEQGRLFFSLSTQVKQFRTWGDCFGHAMVATGRAEIMWDVYFHYWDLIPLKLIVEEAGGYCPGDVIEEGRQTKYRGLSLAPLLKDSLEDLLPFLTD